LPKTAYPESCATQNDPVKERRLLAPGPAYIIRKILEETPRTDIPSGRLFVDRSRQVAWKTGTSYGLRDAWTIGVTDNYTIRRMGGKA